MNAFLTTALTFPTMIYSVLLAVCVIYWLLAATGIVDADGPDGWMGSDGDTVEPAGLAAVLSKIGLAGVPLMLILTVLILFGWGFAYYTQLLILQHLPDALRGLAGVATLLLVLLPGVLVTSLLLRPVARLITRLRPPVPPSVLGKVGSVISPHVDETSGRAGFDDGGAGLILQVRSLPGERFLRGERVVLIEALESASRYRVISEIAFNRQ